MFLLFCKDRPEGLSEDALPQNANSFAESGRTDADTAVQARMLYRKVFSVGFCYFRVFCAFRVLKIFVSL